MKKKRTLSYTQKKNLDHFKPKAYRHFLTLGQLAVVINKDPSWIRKLERRGILPTPTRVQRGLLSIRLYSPGEVKEIKKIMDSITYGPKPGWKRRKQHGYK